MKAFSHLLERLAYTPSRNAKLKLMSDYFRSAPDPDRGWALAALTDGLPFSFPLRRTLTELVATRVDPELYRLSRDYVGDTAETVALIWPERGGAAHVPPRLSDVVERLALAGRDGLGMLLEGWLDALDANARWALLKLIGGAPRVGVSARLAKTALADASPLGIDDIEEVWHALSPPYLELFTWIDGGPKPDIANAPVFRPLMLSHPLQDAELDELDVSQFTVEWKWDGIRVQIVGGTERARLYSRSGDDISAAFPDITDTFRSPGVFDGELLVVRDGIVAPFSDLQQRLNRKTVSRTMMERHPAHVRLYDALLIGNEDLRQLPFIDRRARLEAWHAATCPPRTDLSPLVEIADKDALKLLWSGTRASGVEGLMLKRRSSPYLAGRPKGHWYKWKRDPLVADCVLMYAQRGSGKRSSYHSDFTFGAWTTDAAGKRELVPVGKAYFGFTDAELLDLDRWVRANTVERFGPVRRVMPSLVFEVAFDAVQRSRRHKSGIAMRFPRIHRIRWDKPAGEADELATLEALIER
ncbi:MAG: cisplatin damage response ATP-dependent DNA ligase [Hyphomicrobiaceae bacterium]